MEIIQMRRRLDEQPVTAPLAGITVRTYCGTADIPIWLDLRDRAFARSRVGVRQWTEGDFEQEFLTKPWWRPEHLWFAETSQQCVGTVTLAMRGIEDEARPAVHWLAVLPAWRKRGVGRYLMSVLEGRAWELGYREVRLETHAAWEAAVRLYRAMGYECVATDAAK